MLRVLGKDMISQGHSKRLEDASITSSHSSDESQGPVFSHCQLLLRMHVLSSCQLSAAKDIPLQHGE